MFWGYESTGGEPGDEATKSVHHYTMYHVYRALSPKQRGATPGGQLRTFWEPLYTASTTEIQQKPILILHKGYYGDKMYSGTYK